MQVFKYVSFMKYTLTKGTHGEDKKGCFKTLDQGNE